MRINSLLNDIEADWTVKSEVMPKGPAHPSWLWYKPLADWYKNTPIDSFEYCPDPKIKFFDHDLNELSFPKSPGKVDWDGIIEVLRDRGIVNRAGYRIWCPRQHFSILNEYPDMIERLRE